MHDLGVRDLAGRLWLGLDLGNGTETHGQLAGRSLGLDRGGNTNRCLTAFVLFHTKRDVPNDQPVRHLGGIGILAGYERDPLLIFLPNLMKGASQMLLPELHLLVLEVLQGEVGNVLQLSTVSFLEFLQPLAQRHDLQPEELDTRWVH